MAKKSVRAGAYRKHSGGYKAFIATPLPPDPGLQMDEEMNLTLSEASRCLAELDGLGRMLPGINYFINMYVRKEAILSSQIEGTQVSLEDLLEFEADIKQKEEGAEETSNYVKAMNYGLERLAEGFPMSLRLIKEIHKILIGETRGKQWTPGDFRRSQNWIGGAGSRGIEDAVFVPPPPEELSSHLGDLEKFLHSEDNIPPLIKIALIHAQFETIHPFLDGNGRLGRLMITFYLCWRGILKRPLLYLSYYLKRNRQQYYDLLTDVRFKGDWERWVKFFLRGIIEVSKEAGEAATEIAALERELIRKASREIRSPYTVDLIDLLFQHPMLDVSEVAKCLDMSKPAANNLVNKFESLGILEEVSKRKRDKIYRFRSYIEIIKKGTEL